MSVFPGLESALDEAAHRRYPRRRRRARSWVRWAAVPALALCAAALVLALRPERDVAPPAVEPPVTVPAELLALSDALVAAPEAPPNTRSERVAHGRLRAVATEIAAHVPYPPGASESMDWEGTPPGPYDMGSINDRVTVQFLVEYRAACAWSTFWLHVLQQNNAPALASATAVLQDVPHWPTLRASLKDPYERTQGWNAVAPAALAGDAGPVRTYARANCTEVPTPWNDVIR